MEHVFFGQVWMTCQSEAKGGSAHLNHIESINSPKEGNESFLPEVLLNNRNLLPTLYSKEEKLTSII